MQNLLFQFLLNSVQELCSYHVPCVIFCRCMETDEEEFLAVQFLLQFNATVMIFYLTAQL